MRKFTGHLPLHRPHTTVSSVNCVGISRKLKSTCQDQNNISTSFLSIIYDNLYQYQLMMSPVAVDIDKSVFSCHWLKVSRGLLLLFISWKWSVQNVQKHWWTHIFYRTVIVITFLIKTRPLKSQHFFKEIMKLYYQSNIFIFTNQWNAFYKATTHHPKFVNKMLHYLPVNLRVARRFTDLPQKEARFTCCT